MNRRSRVGTASAHDVAEFADLLRVALGSGFSVLRAVALVGSYVQSPVAAAFARAIEVADDEHTSSVDALAALPDRLGEHSRELCAALVSAARYGAPVLPALERVAFELRFARRVDAEARARRMSVLLLLPLVLCVFPAFVLVAIVPLVLGAIGSLPGVAP